MADDILNRIRITGAKPNLERLFQHLTKAKEEGKGFCGSFKEMPKELIEIKTGFCNTSQGQNNAWRERIEDGKVVCVGLSEEEKASLKERFCTYSWANWAIHFWGVKWDAKMDEKGVDLLMEKNAITLSLVFPWGAPEAIFDHIVRSFDVKISVQLSGGMREPAKVTYQKTGTSFASVN